MKIILQAKERAPNDSSSPFKEEEKGGEEGSKLGGQWKVPSLLANGRFQACWPMEGSKLAGQWKVKEKLFSPLPFSPNNLYPNLQFFCRNPSFGLATKARGCKVAGVKRKEARESKEGSPGAKAKALEGCGPRGGSPGVITYSRESKEVRGSVRE